MIRLFRRSLTGSLVIVLSSLSRPEIPWRFLRDISSICLVMFGALLAVSGAVSILRLVARNSG